jgi:small-conductance mechanosensitive channel
MSAYNPELTLRDARAQYFAVNNFGWGGYDDKWVKVEYGLLRFYFPNTKGRVKVVRYHDLHHILTEYGTSLSGETEIGAWEVATGCTRSLAAWLLNLSGFAAGLFINPGGVYKAFMRGRQSSNLYHLRFDDELLSQRVGQLRQQLSLDKTSEPPTFIDNIVFVFWAIVSVIALLGMIGIALSPLIVLSALAWMLSA